jgi:putative ATP-dependent endonuclease of OLD family
MHIHKVEIKNFRLLQNVQLVLEPHTTVIVGRNNSGKTSLMELFRRLLTDSSLKFSLHDFSLSVHECFWAAFLSKCAALDDNDIRQDLPYIEVKLTVSYEKDLDSLGPLSDFIIDLNPDCTEACIIVRYHLKDGAIGSFFEGLDYDTAITDDQNRILFFKAMKERTPRYYATVVEAEDPNDSDNRKSVEWSKLQALLQSGFINAQRGLDDITHRDRDVLGKILENLFKTAMSESAAQEDKDIAHKLEQAVQNIQESIDGNFSTQLNNLIPAFSIFGYPGLNDPSLQTETTLEVGRLLSDHTKVSYEGINGVNLPESYNGLGSRNLIYILLKLLEFFKSFMASEPSAGIHIIFIEEPEVHLHPQMEEVFINKIYDIVNEFSQTFADGQVWPVQFVVSTHSSHLANKAPFASMRYFLATSDKCASVVRSAKIKDLHAGLSGIPSESIQFLHKYMTLTRCDLLFADKAILIEGITERLMLPRMISKIEEMYPRENKLSSQYLSVVEIGGAFAHIFFDLLDFLELRTLIITDLDTVKQNDNGNYVKCKFSEGTHTSNACIKNWFGRSDITPDELIKESDEAKEQGIRRLAYQLPENDGHACGRSFEDAFILANENLFGLEGDNSQKKEADSWDLASNIKKSDFALNYTINENSWTVPRYISDGIRWLAEGERCPIVPFEQLPQED